MAAPLPWITEAVEIAGHGIVLDGSLAGPGASGLILAAGGSTVRGLVIGGFSLNGIELRGPGGNRIEYNLLGSHPAIQLRPNAGAGILVEDSADNLIGGDLAAPTCASPCNEIGGNGLHGVEIRGPASIRNSVRGNRIGLDGPGAAAHANGSDGVFIHAGASDNRVGGLSSAAGVCDQGCNLIGANGVHGVEISDATSSGNQVTGNFIGLAADGVTALGNGQTGVLAYHAPATRVGGSAGGAGNVLAANRLAGLWVEGAEAGGARVEGNRVGTTAKGDLPRGNGQGVRVVGAPEVVIGGPGAGAGNLLSANQVAGVYIVGAAATGVRVQGNRIGTDATGLASDPDGVPGSGDELGNGRVGVIVDNAPGNLVGGLEPAAGNVLSGNGLHGVEIVGPAARGNQVFGNVIGTSADGAHGLPNGEYGVLIADAGANEIGGPQGRLAGACAGACNVISGNGVGGVGIQGAQAVMNSVAGNFIGLRADGKARLGNGQHGVALTAGAQRTDVGTNAGNVISGNLACGVAVGGADTAWNVIRANLIGLGPDGRPGSLEDLGNRLHGVCIVDSPSNTVGGGSDEARNVIGGNRQDGLRIVGATAAGNEVLGNYVGTDATGNRAAGNGANGVVIEAASDNRIGGRAAGGGNVIGGNGGAGVLLTGLMAGTRGNAVQNNWIGLGAEGTAALPNHRGVEIDSSGTGNRVGGQEPGAGNVISGNRLSGVTISGSSDNWVQANVIGADPSRALALGNGGFGVLLVQGAADNVVGETAAGTPPGGEATNTIAFNGRAGVAVADGAGNAIRGNALFGNGGLGIDLMAPGEIEGVTDNDPLDVDEGANGFQNFPVLELASPSRLRASLDSRPNARFRVEVFGNAGCDGSGYGEGAWFLTAVDLTTDSAGHADIDTALPPSDPAWAFLTLTATDAQGNSSELSACLGPGGPPPTPTSTPGATPGPGPTRTPTPSATAGGQPPPSPTPTRWPGRGGVAFLPLLLRLAVVVDAPPTGAATASPTPSRTAGPTPDQVATAVAATLTALAPSPSASPGTTPDLAGTAIAATLTALARPPTGTPTPPPTASPEPGEVRIAALSTTGEDSRGMRTIFVAGDAISLWIQVDNRSGAPAAPRLDFTVVGRGGYAPPELAWAGPVAAPPGLSWARLERTVPGSAFLGAYTFIGTLSHGGTDTTLSSELFLAPALVRADDFGDPTSGWPDEVTPAHALGYGNGEYHMTITQPDRWVLASPLAWPDVAAVASEVDARSQGATAGATGLALAVNRAADTFYLYEVLRDGRWALFQRVAGTWQAVVAAAASPAVRPGDGPNHLAAVAEGGMLTLYCNGQIVAERELALPSGRVGLYTEAATAGLDAGFDNIRVYATLR